LGGGNAKYIHKNVRKVYINKFQFEKVIENENVAHQMHIRGIYLRTWWTGFEVYRSKTRKFISMGTKVDKTNLNGICGALVIIHGRTHQYIISILEEN